MTKRIHLTMTGSQAGVRLCGRQTAAAGDVDRHYRYSPIDSDANFRAQVCEECLKSVVESYDADEEKPEWVREFFEDKNQLNLL